jgi:hypothetical protein
MRIFPWKVRETGRSFLNTQRKLQKQRPIRKNLMEEPIEEEPETLERAVRRDPAAEPPNATVPRR